MIGRLTKLLQGAFGRNQSAGDGVLQIGGDNKGQIFFHNEHTTYLTVSPHAIKHINMHHPEELVFLFDRKLIQKELEGFLEDAHTKALRTYIYVLPGSEREFPLGVVECYTKFILRHLHTRSDPNLDLNYMPKEEEYRYSLSATNVKDFRCQLADFSNTLIWQKFLLRTGKPESFDKMLEKLGIKHVEDGEHLILTCCIEPGAAQPGLWVHLIDFIKELSRLRLGNSNVTISVFLCLYVSRFCLLPKRDWSVLCAEFLKEKCTEIPNVRVLSALKKPRKKDVNYWVDFSIPSAFKYCCDHTREELRTQGLGGVVRPNSAVLKAKAWKCFGPMPWASKPMAKLEGKLRDAIKNSY